ncbi:MAG TPA: hypothetical protein VFD39_08200 [Trueperaceae bacterium]|nr:hypothetical protein [Trueperaceae bacterium]
MSNRRFDLGSNDKQLTGAILIGVGVLALLGLTGVFRFIGGLVGAVLFGALAYYAYTQGVRRGNTAWRLAAFPLAGLALASILPGAIGGATFLASLGLAFAMYWKLDERRWWAMIPAGTLASLGAVAFLESFMGASAGWLFLFGLAATFFALTRLRVEPQPWAIWPAGALAVVSLMSFTTSGSWLMPVLLIAVGGWLLVRSGAIDLGGRQPPRSAARPEDSGLDETGRGHSTRNGASQIDADRIDMIQDDTLEDDTNPDDANRE